MCLKVDSVYWLEDEIMQAQEWGKKESRCTWIWATCEDGECERAWGVIYKQNREEM